MKTVSELQFSGRVSIGKECSRLFTGSEDLSYDKSQAECLGEERPIDCNTQ